MLCKWTLNSRVFDTVSELKPIWSIIGALLAHLVFSGGKCLVSKVDTVNILQDKHKARGMDWFEEDLYLITPKT